MKIVFLLFIFILSASAVDVGQTAPDFTLKQYQGDNITLSSYRGKVVYLFFIGWGWGFCISAGGSIESGIYTKYSDDDVIVLGIEGWDGTDSQVQSYINRTSPKVTFPILVKGSSVLIDYKTTIDWSMVLDQNGVVRYSDESADIGAITRKIDALLLSSINSPKNTAQTFKLFENYPNPFNPTTQITFNLDKPQTISLKIFDIRGRLVRTIQSGFMESGTHTFRWDGSDAQGRRAASGVYLYQLKGVSGIQTRRMILLE